MDDDKLMELCIELMGITEAMDGRVYVSMCTCKYGKRFQVGVVNRRDTGTRKQTGLCHTFYFLSLSFSPKVRDDKYQMKVTKIQD